MTTYTFQYMSNEDYQNYMLGSLNYTIHTDTVQAQNKAEAMEVAKAKFAQTDYVINDKSFESVEEAQAREQKAIEYAAKVKAEAEQKANVRKTREAKPGYKTRQKWVRANAEIRRKEAMVAALLKEIEEEKEKIAQYAKDYKAETGKDIATK